MTAEIRINVRTTAEIKRDLAITARLRGIKVSSLVNSLVVSAIRDEKEREPSAFRNIIGSDLQRSLVNDKGEIEIDGKAGEKKKVA